MKGRGGDIFQTVRESWDGENLLASADLKARADSVVGWEHWMPALKDWGDMET